MIVTSVRVDNTAALAKTLRGYTPAVQRRLSRPGITKGARVINRAARANAPRRSGELRRALWYVVRTYRSGVVAGVIGPRNRYGRAKAPAATARPGALRRWKLGRGRIPAKYAHLVHGGTAPHVLVRVRRGRGLPDRVVMHPGARANPFLADAWQSTSDEVGRILSQSLAEEIRKHTLRDYKRRGGKGAGS